MKITHIIFSLIFVLVTTLVIPKDNFTSSKVDIKLTKDVIFDGFEGDIFYFTDTNDNVVIVEGLKASKVLDPLQQNNHVGETFNLELKDLKEDNMYSEMQIAAIQPTDK
ncbi:hypothetical protein [Olleya aquimaris]|uniref:Uncharacterized protein n=1 Tax=Olleya aquimaris TaxID=639310 RepID=A0A327R8W9_9FLAO|nr:hypothetical protein [Olleya aquimaris]RAJ11933.1 hypothetical protein LY08_02433 [Olleya aquimaris]